MKNQKIYKITQAVEKILYTIFFSILFINSSFAQVDPSCPEGKGRLGTAADFSVLAGSTFTNTGVTTLIGDVGVSPGSSVTGLTSVNLVGSLRQGDAIAAQAQTDLTNQYDELAGLPFNVDLSGQDLGGLVLTPGVYRFSSSAQLTGTLTLDTLGNPNALFVFQIGSTLTTASGSSVFVVGGPAGNIFWQIGSSATLGTSTLFAGNIIALASVTLNTAASMQCGRALAMTGAVTLDANLIENCKRSDGCDFIVAGAVQTPTPLPIQTPSPTASVGNGDVVSQCTEIKPSTDILRISNKVSNIAAIINKREKTFSAKAEKCGAARATKKTILDTYIIQIDQIIDSSFLKTESNCPETTCISQETTVLKRSLRSLARHIYFLQVKSKRAAIRYCGVSRHSNSRDPQAKDSTYYYKKLLSTINKLPQEKTTCH